VYYVLLFFISLIIFGTLALSSGLNRKGALELHDMIYGTAPKPFVYRQLMPFAIRLGVESIPSEMRDDINLKASQSSTIARILSRVKIPGNLFVDYAVTVFFIYVALWGFVLSFRFFYKQLFDTPNYWVDTVTIGALIGLPSFFSYSFMYDIPTLFIFTLGAGLMIKRKWILYLIVFFIGCWSKETTILLTMIFFLYFYKHEQLRSGFFRNIVVAQIAMFILVKSFLGLVFYDNPGSLVEFHLVHNMLFGYQYSIVTFVTWVVLALLIFYKWNEKPRFLKKALWIAVPLVVLTLFLGLLHEMRDYGELYPFLIGLIAHSTASILKIPCSSKENL